MKDKIFQTTNEKGYKITEYDDGSWACSCPAWIFHRGQKVNCKHIIQIQQIRAFPSIKQAIGSSTTTEKIESEVILQGLLGKENEIKEVVKR